MDKENKDEYVILSHTIKLDSMFSPVKDTTDTFISDIYDGVDETIARAHCLLCDLYNVDGFDGFVEGYKPFDPDIDPHHLDRVKIVITKFIDGSYKLMLLKIESVEQLAESFRKGR